MTEKGTFIINGAERVVVNQLIRSSGVYFDEEQTKKTEGGLLLPILSLTGEPG